MISLTVFIIIGIMTSCGFTGINYPFDFTTVYQVANLLENTSSSYFPGPTILNYVLFGYENATYSFDDFLTWYGSKALSPKPGDIIIGNDRKLWGIFDNNGKVIIPVPSKKVQAVPKSTLKNYFPKGYVVKTPKYGDYTNLVYSGEMTGYLGNETICDSCDIEIWNYVSFPYNNLGSVFWLHQKVQFDEPFIDIFGYFDQYDFMTDTGTWTIRFVESNAQSKLASYNFVDPLVSNSVSFSTDIFKGFTFNGSIPILFKNQTLNYSFNGKLSSIRNPTLHSSTN